MSALTLRPRSKRRSRRLRKRLVWLAVAGAAILAVVLVVAALTFGSNRAPQGQVIAQIGRTEITHADLEAEARAQGLSSNSALSAPVVQAVIARTLLAREAERRGIQRSPTYPSDRRRADAQLLASGALRALPSPPAPSAAEIAAFIAAHPERFAERQRWLLNELRYPASRAPDLAGATLEEAKAKLEAARQPYQPLTISSLAPDVPAPLQHALSVTPQGRMAVWCIGGGCTAIAISASEAAPVDADMAQTAARTALLTAARERQVRLLVNQLRARESVRLQAGVPD